MTIKKGDKAPSFTLISAEKKPVSLGDYEGKNVVILFFPFAFTGVCTEELCSMRDNIAMYADLDASILGISVDSPFTLEKFKSEQNLNFPLLSDFNKEASRAYGSLYEEFPAFGLRGVSKRSVFVIDKAGIIQHVEICPSPGDMPNFDAVKETLSSLN